VSAAAATWGAARMSASTTCFTIKDTSTGGTSYGQGGTCTGANAVAASGAGAATNASWS
jgi:hypothetical protein